jgi:uncharacterized protein YecE (DUF72 family)
VVQFQTARQGESVRVFVGTSGYAYKEWKGAFYPAKLPAAEMLRFYASRLAAVEINNTFYRMPSERVLLDWAAQVPETFRFVLKASQRITHYARLKIEDDSLEYFLRTANVLGDRLGPTLFQLPPNLKKDYQRLTDFLAKLPRTWRAAIEFRHDSWLADDVLDALRAREIALVGVDDDEGGTPLIPTASWGYLRLRRTGYDPAGLAAWAERIRDQPWEEAYAFLKHDEEGIEANGPRWAEELARLTSG